MNNTTNEMLSSTMDIAAAPVRSSFSIRVRIHWEDTSVLPGTAPPMSTTEPNSPMARENASPAPVNNDGVNDGSTTEVKIVTLLAPSEAAASSVSRSISSSTGCTARTTNGSVTNASATATPQPVCCRCSPTGLCGPYSASITRL